MYRKLIGDLQNRENPPRWAEFVTDPKVWGVTLVVGALTGWVAAMWWLFSGLGLLFIAIAGFVLIVVWFGLGLMSS